MTSHNVNPFNSLDELQRPDVPFPHRDVRFGRNVMDSYGNLQTSEFPVGINESNIWGPVTLGKVEQSTNSHKDTSHFVGTEGAMISENLPRQRRGIYFEESEIQPDTLTPFLPTQYITNYEQDLRSQVYYDGTPLSLGLAEQMSVQQRIQKVKDLKELELKMRSEALQPEQKGESRSRRWRRATDARLQAMEQASQLQVDINTIVAGKLEQLEQDVERAEKKQGVDFVEKMKQD